MESTLKEFHDFLIAYRQTPRSKIIKKHAPDLDCVLEAESNFEKSSFITLAKNRTSAQQSDRLNFNLSSKQHASCTLSINEDSEPIESDETGLLQKKT